MSNIIPKDSKIAILCGGMSSEREISLRSGKNCYDALQRLGYFNSRIFDLNADNINELKMFDFAYNTLHGKYGEDGCIQGILELLKIPYTGCGVMSSAICMNKEYTKKIMKNANIPLINSIYLSSKDDFISEINKAKLKYPLMIKPVSEGSSFGMNKVNSQEELSSAIKEALKYNNNILVEEYLTGISATVGVLEKNNEAFATEILELRPKNEWYDYEAKYTKGMTEFILPAEIPTEMSNKVKEIAIKAFKICGCSGVSRVDFLITKNVPYVLEINTNPGMTDTSDLPAQAAVCGITYDNLVELILESVGLNK